MDILQKISMSILVCDGAMGTMLMARGLKQGTPPETWNLDKPENLAEIHKEYYEAGSDWVHTNTFGANRIKLESCALEKFIEEINRNAVNAAKSVCPHDCFVAADIGPTGKLMKPFGELEPEHMESVYSEQAQYLDRAGVDIFSIETMFDLREALAALKGIKKVSEKPVSVSMTFNRGKKGFRTIMGDEPVRSLRILIDGGADIVGSNCSLDSTDMLELTKYITAARIAAPLIIQPNAGQPHTEDEKLCYPENPDEFSMNILKIVEAGAKVVGGCCGTTPEFIKFISKKVRQERQKI